MKRESKRKKNGESHNRSNAMWNYRIIKYATKHNHEGDEDCYGMYETYYNDAGEICAHDDIPTIVGDSVEDIRKTLSMMTADAIRFEVLDGDKIKFVEFDGMSSDGMPKSGEYQPFDPEDEGFMKDATPSRGNLDENNN